MTLWQRIVWAIYGFLASMYGDVPSDEQIREHFKKNRLF